MCIICRLSASNHEQFIQVHLCWVQLWLKLWVFVAVAISKATMLWFNENPFPFFLIIIIMIIFVLVDVSVSWFACLPTLYLLYLRLADIQIVHTSQVSIRRELIVNKNTTTATKRKKRKLFNFTLICIWNLSMYLGFLKIYICFSLMNNLNKWKWMYGSWE